MPINKWAWLSIEIVEIQLATSAGITDLGIDRSREQSSIAHERYSVYIRILTQLAKAGTAY